MAATPEGMGHHIMLSVKMTLKVISARINVLVYFYITTLTLLYSLRLQGGVGTIALLPLNPPLPIPHSYMDNNL